MIAVFIKELYEDSYTREEKPGEDQGRRLCNAVNYRLRNKYQILATRSREERAWWFCPISRKPDLGYVAS